MKLKIVEKIKVGNRFWLSQLALIIGGISFLIFLLFLAILYTGKGLPLEMSGIYYGEIMHNYVYYGFGISLAFCLIGFKASEIRKWTTTDLIIDEDRIEFTKNNKKVDLPRQRILKLVLLKSYLTKENKVRIRTNGLKRYLVKIDDNVYNKLVEIYNDRFYQD